MPPNPLIEIFTVNINVNNPGQDYISEISKYTLPRMEAYAERIGAKFTQIKERKFPDYPCTYEKIQIYELGKLNQINILIDLDLLISKTMPSVLYHYDVMSIAAWMVYGAKFFYTPNKYFLRDKRNIAIATNFVMTSFYTHDAWKPFNKPFEQVRQNCKREFIIDEYCFSNNVAKYGLKVSPIFDNIYENNSFYHINYTTGLVNDAVEKIQTRILDWGE